LPLDESGNVVQGVRLNPRTVSVTVAIEKKQNYREVVVRARTAGQPARGYFVSGVNVVPSTVTIIGPPDVIEPMGGLVDLIHEIDIGGATRMVADKLPLALPEGVSVLGSQEGQEFEILVTVGIDAVTGGTTVELPLRSTRLQDDLVARVSVPIVDVILTGPSVLIDELETNLLDAYLDLSGLGEGTHQVRPQVDILVAQDSQLRQLVVKDISPKLVEVVIGKPPTATPTAMLSINGTPTISPTITATVALTATTTISPTRTPATGR
jgi:YbbR domain-containing protein